MTQQQLTDDAVLACLAGSDVTSANYRSKLSILRKKLGLPITHILMHPDEVYPLIQRAYPHASSRRTMMVAVLAAFRRLEGSEWLDSPARQRWVKLHINVRAVTDMESKRNEPTVRQLQSYVSYDDVVLKLRELKKLPRAHEQLTSSARLVLLSMIAGQRPKRNDHGRCRIYYDQDPGPDIAENHLVWHRNSRPERAYFVYVNFKTKKRYHRVEEDADPGFLDDLRASLRRHPRDYVFVNRDGRPFATNTAYGKFVQRTFAALFDGRAAGTSLLRHVYISTKLDLSKMTVAEREQEARLMMHSPALQAKYEWSDASRENLCASLCGVPKSAPRNRGK